MSNWFKRLFGQCACHKGGCCQKEGSDCCHEESSEKNPISEPAPKAEESSSNTEIKTE